MKLLSIVKYLAVALVIITIAMIFTPVPTATESNTYDVHCKISKVFAGPSYDIVFKIEGQKVSPYINRGVQQGLNIDELQTKLVGNDVHLKFVNHWTPLDPGKSHPTLAYIKLKKTGEVLYNSIRS